MDANSAPPSVVFGDMLRNTPVPVRNFLKSTLGLNELDQLYQTARSQSGNGSLCRTMLDLLGVRVGFKPEDMRRVPSSGPVIIVANHPFGFLEGLIADGFLTFIR